MDERIINWARWANPKPPQQHCGSVEHKYRSPWRQWVELIDIRSGTPINPLDAQWVEKNCWRPLPFVRRLITRYALINRLPDNQIKHRLLKANHPLPYPVIASEFEAAVRQMERLLVKEG